MSTRDERRETRMMAGGTVFVCNKCRHEEFVPYAIDMPKDWGLMTFRLDALGGRPLHAHVCDSCQVELLHFFPLNPEPQPEPRPRKKKKPDEPEMEPE